MVWLFAQFAALLSTDDNKNLNMDNNVKIEKLLDFVRDTESLEKLSEWTSKPNIFDVLKISRTETRHSYMLAWLLDPNENHGLGSAFLFGIVAKISSIINKGDKKFFLKLLTGDLSSFSIFRERYNIDILLVSSEQKTVIAIENKIGSKEHDSGKSGESQLQKYSEIINEKYKRYNKFLIYLTPDGDIPSVGGWEIMNYYDILAVLEPIFESRKDNLGAETRLLIENYIETIKRNVTMDEKLVELCNEIYKTHKDAIDLIIENKDDNTQHISEICRNILEKYEGVEISSSKNSKTNIAFKTESLKEAFKKYENLDCFFQIRIRTKFNYMMIELIFQNRGMNKNDNKELVDDMKKWPNNTKSNIDRDAWKWKSIWSEWFEDLENATEDEIKEWIKKQIEVAMNMKGK